MFPAHATSEQKRLVEFVDSSRGPRALSIGAGPTEGGCDLDQTPSFPTKLHQSCEKELTLSSGFVV